MSTTTVSVRSTARDADLAAVRRREAQAREAAHEARRRAAEQRRREAEELRREEQRRRRIAQLNQQVVAQEIRFQGLVERLDDAARRLPDLSLKAPRLASMSDKVATDPDRLADYVAQLTADVEKLARRVDRGIAEAEHQLQRRIARASAWRRTADLDQRIDLLLRQGRETAAEIGVSPELQALPARPHPDVDLEAVEAYEKELQACLDKMKNRYASLRARVQSRANAIRIGGALVQTSDAGDVLVRHREAEHARAMAEQRAHRDAELARAGLRLEDLPGAVRELIDSALEQAPNRDYCPSITRWIAREKRKREGVERALGLMQSAPDMVHDDLELSRRWASLAAQLQRIAGGQEDFSVSVEHEYEQLRADAGRLVNTAFTRADWVEAMCQQGFEVLEREDGEGLIVVDLDQPEIWLEATEYTDEQGSFAATLELKTDAQLLPGEAAITDSVCQKLAQAASSAAPDVAAEAAVVEHENRIKRARRPAAARKTFAQSL